MSSHASCIGCRSRPTVAGSPSIVVMWSVDLICETGTEHGLNALPLMWLVQALQTPMPQPYFGPGTPRRSRRTHSSRTSSSTSTDTRLPLRMKVCVAMGCSYLTFLRPLVGDGGIGGTVGNGVKCNGPSWLIGNVVGTLPVARA